MSQTRTPGIWNAWVEDGQLHKFYRITDGNGLLVATGILAEHAERIALCCNAHDDLVAALKAMCSDDVDFRADLSTFLAWLNVRFEQARAALAKAGEK